MLSQKGLLWHDMYLCYKKQIICRLLSATCNGEQSSPAYVLLTPKVPKVALIAMQRPHAKMYAAR